MSFWKKAGELAIKTAKDAIKDAIKDGKKFVEDYDKYEVEYQNYSDEKLIKIYKSSAPLAKRATAARILKNRRGSEQV